jgi:hypothetical protein
MLPALAFLHCTATARLAIVVVTMLSLGGVHVEHGLVALICSCICTGVFVVRGCRVKLLAKGNAVNRVQHQGVRLGGINSQKSVP